MPQSTELTLCDAQGLNFSLYYNVGTCETPVWVFHKGVTGDLNIGETEDEQERSTRDPAQLVKQYVGSKIDVEISGEQVVDQLYEGCAFLNAMRSNGSPGDVLALSNRINTVGAMGWRGKFRNFDRSMSGPEEGAASQTFRLKPAACQDEDCKVRPVIVEVADAIEDYDPQTFVATSS